MNGASSTKVHKGPQDDFLKCCCMSLLKPAKQNRLLCSIQLMICCQKLNLLQFTVSPLSDEVYYNYLMQPPHLLFSVNSPDCTDLALSLLQLLDNIIALCMPYGSFTKFSIEKNMNIFKYQHSCVFGYKAFPSLDMFTFRKHTVLIIYMESAQPSTMTFISNINVTRVTSIVYSILYTLYCLFPQTPYLIIHCNFQPRVL